MILLHKSDVNPTTGQESLYIMSNENRVRAINFTVSTDLVVINTLFPWNVIHKQICVSQNTINKSQIYHVIVDKRHKSDKSNLRSYRGVDRDTNLYFFYSFYNRQYTHPWKHSRNCFRDGSPSFIYKYNTSLCNSKLEEGQSSACLTLTLCETIIG